MTHALKISPQYFKDVETGQKTFEVRKDDRPYTLGDILLLCEYDITKETYTKKKLVRRISYILRDKQYCKKGYVILGIEPV